MEHIMLLLAQLGYFYLNFDMDGTLADLYHVSGWLDKLRAYDTSPYEEARPMFNKKWMTAQLNALQAQGFRLRIISWGSKESTPAFDEATRLAKEAWLAQYLPDVHWDEICVVPYGTPKHEVGTIPGGILFDDSKPVRTAWGDNAYDEEFMFSILKSLGR